MLALFLCILLIACSSNNGKLDRAKAKKIIIEKTHYPKQIKEQVNYGELLYGNISGNNSAMEKNQALASKNLINFKYSRQERDMFFTYDVYNLSLTSEGEKYKIGQGNNSNGIPYYIVKGGEKDFGEITGMKENEDKSVSVDYTTIIKNVTPFGLIIGNNSYYEGQTENHSAKFIKYDDGWRIEN